MIFEHCKWHFHTNWEKLEKYRADVFQVYPNAIRFNLLELCPSMSLFGLSVFLLSSSTVLSRYCDISVNFMTSRSVPKLPKIAWHSPFKTEFLQTTCQSCDVNIVLSNKGTVIERSIEFDYWSFGNRTFDCIRLAKFYCEFDYVRLSSAIERLVFDWARLPNCSKRG